MLSSTRSLALVALLACPAVAWAAGISQTLYSCDRGVTLPVTLIEIEGPDIAVIYVDRLQVALREDEDASGRGFYQDGMADQYGYSLHIYKDEVQVAHRTPPEVNGSPFSVSVVLFHCPL